MVCVQNAQGGGFNWNICVMAKCDWRQREDVGVFMVFPMMLRNRGFLWHFLFINRASLSSLETHGPLAFASQMMGLQVCTPCLRQNLAIYPRAQIRHPPASDFQVLALQLELQHYRQGSLCS